MCVVKPNPCWYKIRTSKAVFIWVVSKWNRYFCYKNRLSQDPAHWPTPRNGPKESKSWSNDFRTDLKTPRQLSLKLALKNCLQSSDWLLLLIVHFKNQKNSKFGFTWDSGLIIRKQKLWRGNRRICKTVRYVGKTWKSRNAITGLTTMIIQAFRKMMNTRDIYS